MRFRRRKTYLDTADAVSRAFEARPRRNFLPAHVQARADEDIPLPIGFGQTNSQPRTVADMLRLLDVHPGLRVLDVGAGSGWSTALLAELVTSTGSVHATELVPELVTIAQATLAKQNLPWATLEHATPSVLGVPEQAPFDRILVSAEAATLPQELVEQLAPGGVMVIPVAGHMLRITRHDNEYHVTRHGAYRFVPLLTESD